MLETVEEWISTKKKNLKEFSPFSIENVYQLIDAVWDILFPNTKHKILDIDYYFKEKIEIIQTSLKIIFQEIEDFSQQNQNRIINEFLMGLPQIEEILNTDLDAIYDGDPAANSRLEILLCYPGFYAIFIYRIAHEFARLGIPLLPRVLSEIAHSKTGIDIHPNATIGHHFCIDHGTGIVIGETTRIGDYVKIYQGVTLGALSLRDGHKLKGTQRHPTISDHVTIYSEASIFGGETVIGPNVTIGSNAFITSSVSRETQRIPQKKRL